MADTDYNDSGSEADLDGGKKQRRSAAGRKLMRWNPDVDQYVLLAVEQACSEQGQPVPWNSVALKLNEYVTGEGIKQHLAKVRKYREENDRPVPPKSSAKGGNRKAAAYGTGVTNTPQRTPKKKKIGEDGDAPVTGKGAGLLWSNPKKQLKELNTPKEPNTPKEIKEPKEQKPKEANKKSQGEAAAPVTLKTPAKKSRKSNVKADTKVDDDEKVTTTKKSTGKRGRTKKEPSVKGEDADAEGDEDFENESPTKKQRTLRATYQVNYNENEIAGIAGDEYEEEDIFEARSDGSGDRAYDDRIYGSQPNTGLKSKGASSRSSAKGMTTPVQPPPNFDNMLHSRTGVHAYGGGYIDEGQASNFGGPFTGIDTSYGPGGFGDGQDMGMGGDDMMGGYGSQFNGLPYMTADQQQMLSENNGYGGYGNNQHAHGPQGQAETPVRKARKQEAGRGDKIKDEGTTTPLGKKDKKKHQDFTKQTPKQKSDRKVRKNSAHASDNSGEQQQTNFSNDDNFGNIPITNDTGRGFGPGHGQSHGFGTSGMPNFSMPLTTYDPQQSQTLTASPTDISGDFKFPGAGSGFDNNSTGITPHFNNFNFDNTNQGADFPMPSVEFGGGFGNDQYGGMATLNTSFSNSTDASTAGSQSDQKMPSMHFGGVAEAGAGLGLGDAWMPGTGMGMDMSGDGEQELDIFSLLNHDGYH